MLKTTLCVITCSCTLLSALENTINKDTILPVYLSSSQPYAPKGSNLFLLAEWIYWQANETGLSYAVENENFNILDDTIMGSGHVVQPKFDWHSGVRFGLGYNIPHDGWDVQFVWTWYEDQANNEQTSSGDNPTILPTYIHPNIYNAQSIAASNSANANLFLHLNMMDLDLGKQFKVSKALSLKPFLGLRTAWLNQTYNIQYTDLFDKSADLVLNEYSTNIKNNFWGIGILGGLGSEWNLKWGISFFGNCALSLLYGFFDLDHTESFIHTSGFGDIVISDTNSFRASRAIADLQLGLRWSASCIKDRLKIVLQGGWEQHMFFSQNQMTRFIDGQSWGTFVQNQGDVDFQGWSAAAHLYF